MSLRECPSLNASDCCERTSRKRNTAQRQYSNNILREGKVKRRVMMGKEKKRKETTHTANKMKERNDNGSYTMTASKMKVIREGNKKNRRKYTLSIIMKQVKGEAVMGNNGLCQVRQCKDKVKITKGNVL